jgi:Tfp pilus assembly protein PilN
MRAVNLLPREQSRRSRLNEQNLAPILGAAVGAVVVAVLAGGYLVQSSKVADAQRALDAAQTKLAATPVPPATKPVETTPPAVAAEQQPRLQAVSSALSQRIAWDRILREFSLVLPNDVWLTSLTMTAPAGVSLPGAAATTGFTMSGTTYSYSSVARLLSRLSLVPDLTGVTLSTTSRQGRLVQFGVNAAVKGAALPVAPAPVVPAPTDTSGATPTSTTPGASS